MAFLTTIGWKRRGRRAPRRRAAWLLGVLLLSAVAPATGTPATTADEYKIKAAFLFNFAQFVEWPARAFRGAEAPLVIGVLGEDPFGAYLDELVSGEKIGRRPLVVRRYRRVEDITDCQILFISASQAEAVAKIVAQLKGRSILTVGDMEAFARRGGMVRFATENGKIRLRINVEAAKACELTISSKILSPATMVTSDKN